MQDKQKERKQSVPTKGKKAPKSVKTTPKKDDELAKLKKKLQETDNEACPFC